MKRFIFLELQSETSPLMMMTFEVLIAKFSSHLGEFAIFVLTNNQKSIKSFLLSERVKQIEEMQYSLLLKEKLNEFLAI